MDAAAATTAALEFLTDSAQPFFETFLERVGRDFQPLLTDGSARLEAEGALLAGGLAEPVAPAERAAVEAFASHPHAWNTHWREFGEGLSAELQNFVAERPAAGGRTASDASLAREISESSTEPLGATAMEHFLKRAVFGPSPAAATASSSSSSSSSARSCGSASPRMERDATTGTSRSASPSASTRATTPPCGAVSGGKSARSTGLDRGGDGREALRQIVDAVADYVNFCCWVRRYLARCELGVECSTMYAPGLGGDRRRRSSDWLSDDDFEDPLAGI